MKKKWIGLWSLIALLVVVLCLMVTGWQPQNSNSKKPIRVVTSLNFYGEVAQSVAGKYGHVTSFIDNASVDPHDYQPSTKQARQLNNANVVIANGLGYDHWLSKMVASDKGNRTVINVGTQVAHKKSGDNEHVWYRPQTMRNLSEKLAAQYSHLDPHHRSYYYANAHKYQAKLKTLNQTIRRAKKNAQSAKEKRVLVSEPVFDYALQNLGYQVVDTHFEKAVEDGSDPSPSDISQMQNEIKQRQVAFFVNNKQESNGTIRNMLKLAKQHRVPVLNVTEAKPNHKTYVEWMQSQYQQLIKIQERGD